MLRPYAPCALSRAARRELRVRGRSRGGVVGCRGAVDGGGRDGGVRDGGGRDGGGRDGAGLSAAACALAACATASALFAFPTASRSRTMSQPTAWC